MSILDARAQLVCNIGPIISGSLSDDHQQGRGVIRTQGSLLLSGLFSPALGSVVNLAYVDASGNRLARFPRATLRVISSYADPFTRQTTVEVGCLMTYLGNRSGRISSVDGLYRLHLLSRSKLVPKRISGTSLLVALVNTLGLNVNTITLIGPQIYYDIEELQGKTQNYVELLDQLLSTHNHSSYINDQETLVIYPLFAQLNGPRLTFDSFIDVAPTSGGDEPGQVAVARGTYLAIPEEKEEKQITVRSASPNTTEQPLQPVVTNSPTQPLTTPAVPAAPVTSGSLANTATGQAPGTDANGSEQASSDTWKQSDSSNSGVMLLTGETYEGTPYSFTVAYTEVASSSEFYNSDGIVIERINKESQPLVRVNTQLVEDYIRFYGTYPSFAEQPYQRITTEKFFYDISYSEDGEPDYTLIRKQQYTYISVVEMVGSMGISDYEWFNFDIPAGTLVSEKVDTTYVVTQFATKEVVRTYRCIGATQVGQQSIGKALQELKRPVFGAGYDASGAALWDYGYLDIRLHLAQYTPLVLDAVRINKQSETPRPAQLDFEQERRTYVGVTQQATTTIPAASTPIPGPVAGPSSAVNTVKEFRLPLEPADEQLTPESPVIKSRVEEIAQDFAAVQNRLLYGHRLGRQFVTTLGVLPLYPYQAFHVEYNGVVASYRVNGTSFAFDQTQCLVSTDGLYAGVAGGSSIGGANWVPLPPGATQLPLVPATTNNGAQVTANSAALASPINTGNQASVNALIAALPSGQTQGFQYTSAPAAVLAPFVTTQLVSGAVRLPLTVKTFNTVQTQLRTSFVARIKITGTSGDPAIAPIRLPLELVELPSANNIATPVIVVAGMVATGPFTAVQSPVQVVAEVA